MWVYYKAPKHQSTCGVAEHAPGRKHTVHARLVRPRLIEDTLSISGIGSCSKSVQLSISTETGSYFRLIDSCITQHKAQGPSRTCNESKEEKEKRIPISRFLPRSSVQGGLM